MVKIAEIILCAACIFILSGCTEDSAPLRSEVSERPGGEIASMQLQPGTSNIGLRLRLGYDELEVVLAKEVPEIQQGDGRKRVCKRVIGIKVCGTANWHYTATRTGDIGVTGKVDTVYFDIPIRFNGTAGVDGDAAKALGLHDIDFQGAVAATIGLTFDLDDQWCPAITSDIQYRWTESPKVRWAGGIDIGIQSRLDEAIDEQLEDIDDRIRASIDCEKFRQQLSEQWKTHSFPLELPESPSEQSTKSSTTVDAVQKTGNEPSGSHLYLNIQPRNMKFSGVKTEADRLGVSFVLLSETTIDKTAIPNQPVELPALSRTDYAVGKTRFELPIQLPYEFLERYARDEVVGRTFTNSQSAADLSVTVTDIEFFASEEGLTIGLMFDADLPASRRNTSGRLYLTTLPVIDTFNRTLSLTQTSLSPVIDSALWQILASIFENHIIRALEQKTVIFLGDHLEELEQKVAAQLSSPDQTGGLLVTADQPRIQLLAIVPEAEALVLRVEFSTELDIDVPAEIITGSSGFSDR